VNIYIASPYTHSSDVVKQDRFERVAHFTAKVMRDGGFAFSPIVHGHQLSVLHSLPDDFAYWERYCLSTLSLAKVLYVLMLDGWLESVGVQAEIAFAEQNNIPVAYYEPETYEVAA
jgi:hypothetical protein